MRTYLNAGFGEPLPQEDLALIQSLKFAGIRQDVWTAASAFDLVRQFVGLQLEPIFLVGGARPFNSDDMIETARAVIDAIHSLEIPGAAVEVGNELDLLKVSPYEFGGWVSDVWAFTSWTPIISGGISNTSPEAISWLNRAMTVIPDEVVVGYHSYRENPSTPKKGYKSRSDEFDALVAVADGRRLVCTEFGYHTASVRGCLGRRKPGLTDDQVATYVGQEMAIGEVNQIQSMTLFQLNDGPLDTAEHRYGIRRMDGTLKPVAYVVGESQ